MLPLGCRWSYELIFEGDDATLGNGIGGDSGAGGSVTGAGGSGNFGGSVAGAPGTCGDGMLDPDQGETCDDGGESATCDSDCSAAECGDDVVNALAGEECEPGLDAGCDVDCNYGFMQHLVNRFSFEGTGDQAVDSAGSGDGLIVGTTLSGSGELTLTGETGSGQQYASLANGLASAHTNATFEAWVTWDGGGPWQRIFDFGSSDTGETQQGTGTTYLYLTPQAWDSAGGMRVAFSTDGNASETVLESQSALAIGVQTHVAVAVDDDNDLMLLYVNGVLDTQGAFTESLSSLDDFNAWLGLSQFALDPPLDGSIDEFRIYDAALTASHIQQSFAAGPDI